MIDKADGGVDARAYAAARRAAARRHHPDRGGDPEAFIAAMADLERRFRPVDSATTKPRVRVHTSPLTGKIRHAHGIGRAVLRRVRARLPRSLPGSRRYATFT